jgi:protein-tyrosine phosphatase
VILVRDVIVPTKPGLARFDHAFGCLARLLSEDHSDHYGIRVDPIDDPPAGVRDPLICDRPAAQLLEMNALPGLQRAGSLANLRDVGGLPSEIGGRIVCGRLFRSACFSSADVNARASADDDLTISRLVDLRMPEEVEEQGALQLRECNRLHIPLFDTLQPHWPNPRDRTPAATAARYFEMVESGRRSLVEIISLLGSCDAEPTLIHCHAGRDRTGIVIACALDVLGVPDQEIGLDYSLSSVVDDAEARNADPANALCLLRLIRAEYGSTTAMLLSFGLTIADVMRLRQALLEPL